MAIISRCNLPSSFYHLYKVKIVIVFPSICISRPFHSWRQNVNKTQTLEWNLTSQTSAGVAFFLTFPRSQFLSKIQAVSLISIIFKSKPFRFLLSHSLFLTPIHYITFFFGLTMRHEIPMQCQDRIEFNRFRVTRPWKWGSSCDPIWLLQFTQ